MSEKMILAVKTASQTIVEIEELIDLVPEAGEDFAESVREKTDKIKEYIEWHDFITEPQLDALNNMLGGLKKWVDHD